MTRADHLCRATGGSDCWRTPIALLDLVRRIGPIALDPCASDDRAHWFADRNLTAADDGLATPWIPFADGGLVFANPPYSACAAWVDKAAREAGQGAQVLLLVPARPGCRWYRSARAAADCLVELHGRLTFVGAPTGAPFPSALIGLGLSWRAVSRAFGDRGVIQIPSAAEVAPLAPAVPVAPRKPIPAPTGRGSGKSQHSASGGKPPPYEGTS